jgi:hypothetical protein
VVMLSVWQLRMKGFHAWHLDAALKADCSLGCLPRVTRILRGVTMATA